MLRCVIKYHCMRITEAVIRMTPVKTSNIDAQRIYIWFRILVLLYSYFMLRHFIFSIIHIFLIFTSRCSHNMLKYKVRRKIFLHWRKHANTWFSLFMKIILNSKTEFTCIFFNVISVSREFICNATHTLQVDQ